MTTQTKKTQSRTAPRQTQAAKAKEGSTATPEIDKKWLQGFLASMNATQRKSFDALDLDTRRIQVQQAWEAHLSAEPAERASRVRIDGERERVAIERADGSFVEVEPLPESTNKGQALPDSPRGKVLARKKEDALLLGGKVVRILAVG